MEDDQTVHLLLVYSLKQRKLVETREFEGENATERAMEAFEAVEREHMWDRETEVVLIGADDFETIKKTHASYWMGGDPTKTLPKLEALIMQSQAL